MKRILIINTYGIGDVLFTTPLINNLRQANPQVNITYLANRRTEAFLKDNPYINRIVVYERDEWVALYRNNPLRYFGQWLAFIKQLRGAHYDCVLDFSLNGMFGFLMVLAGIPRRIGYNYRNRGIWLTDKLPFKGFEGKHVIEYYLDLARLLGIDITDKRMMFNVPARDMQWAKDLIAQQQPHQRPIIVLVPGGGASWGKAAGNKRWGAKNFADLADKIVEEINGLVILVGDKAEQDLVNGIIQQVHHPVLNLTGQVSLAQMAAVFKNSHLVIANDGGPLHVAVANRVKTVSLFGPVDPRVYGPYPSDNHCVVTLGLACQPCYQRFRMAACGRINCLNQLPVERVLEAVKDQINNLNEGL